MSDGYLLPPRKARFCRWAGAVFLLLAAGSTSGIVLAAFIPETLGFAARMGWDVNSTPVQLFTLAEQREINATPAARHAFDAYLARPAVRLGMAGVAAIDALPFAVLLLGVGLALRRLGGRGADPLAGALPWLRRASIAAIVWALAVPFADSLRVMLLYPGTPAGPHWSLTLDFGGIGIALMLAVAAYATVWALEAGWRAQRALAEFV